MSEGASSGKLDLKRRSSSRRPISPAPKDITQETEAISAPASSRRKVRKSIQQEPVSFTFLRKSGATVDWDIYLRDPSGIQWICPVDFFEHAPLAKQWKHFALEKIGSKVELLHPRSVGNGMVFCVGTLVKFAGYKVLVRFENVSKSNCNYAWVSFCSDVVKPLGHAFENNCLVLPVDIQKLDSCEPLELSEETLEGFFQRVYGDEPSQTGVTDDHVQILQSYLSSYGKTFRLNDIVEVLDKEDPVQNRLALVTCVVGDRVTIKYLDADETDNGHCFNMSSDNIHPLGWSHCVGQTLLGYEKGTCQLPSIPKKAFPSLPDVYIAPGMVFECIHPYYHYKVCCGFVKRKLKHGYFVAIVESNYLQDFAEYVFHITSPYVLPCGWASMHNVHLEPPLYEEEPFSWSVYQTKCGADGLLVQNMSSQKNHPFVPGSKLEAAEITQPSYVGPATVLNVANHLLYIHFDGWPREEIASYQWVSAFSADIYPAGWAQLVGHRVQGHVDKPQLNDLFYIDNDQMI